MKPTTYGKLYLIPCTLSNPGETTVLPEDVLPQQVKRIIDCIDYYIVEKDSVIKSHSDMGCSWLSHCYLLWLYIQNYSQGARRETFPIQTVSFVDTSRLLSGV